ncbi:hypothetical protein VTK73DRAFT_6979 [Phialemonium thermophilum]|uniref:F-box domain-containing protein n=1 Tax=Phialemonium thermophilum TaxID=223376 RepID=A0ABR3WH29_9PEZI
MVLLTQLPPEILHNVLSYVLPEDLPQLCRVCRFLHSYISGNAVLCRDIYYSVLDLPVSGTDETIDWEQELKDYIKLKAICRHRGPEKTKELGFVHDTVTRILKRSPSGEFRESRPVTHSPSRNLEFLRKLFARKHNRVAFLMRSSLFEFARGETYRFREPPLPEQQQSAKLHCLFGTAILRCGRTRSSRMHPYACARVYDLRRYTQATMWGPFMSDGSGRVDWERVEAVMIVLSQNIRDKNINSSPLFANLWKSPFAGSWPNSYVPWPPDREPLSLDDQDPYGVSGTFMRIVCFLDYSDFFAFNFPLTERSPHDVLPDMPRPALEFEEATRLILMKLHVTKIEPPGEGDGKDLPVVHFKGVSRALDGSWDDNANSDIRGTVRLTPEGEVRWTTFSIFDGEERWRSEGIQVGGLRSARGVLGHWFDKDYEPHGPCGPTAFWKLSDLDAKSERDKIFVYDFLPLLAEDDNDPAASTTVEVEDDDDDGDWRDEEEFQHGVSLIY